MPEARFELHPQLAADTVFVRDLGLSMLRLMNCSDVPWLVLVPRRQGVREIIDLETQDRQTLWHEIAAVSEMLRTVTHPHKLNIAALGNMVEQLHIHIIARFTTDAAWPKPVWGNLPMVSYRASDLAETVEKFSNAKISA